MIQQRVLDEFARQSTDFVLRPQVQLFALFGIWTQSSSVDGGTVIHSPEWRDGPISPQQAEEMRGVIDMWMAALGGRDGPGVTITARSHGIGARLRGSLFIADAINSPNTIFVNTQSDRYPAAQTLGRVFDANGSPERGASSLTMGLTMQLTHELVHAVRGETDEARAVERTNSARRALGMPQRLGYTNRFEGNRTWQAR